MGVPTKPGSEALAFIAASEQNAEMDALELLKKPAGKTLEFKRDLSSPRDILRVLVTFATLFEFMGIGKGNLCLRWFH